MVLGASIRWVTARPNYAALNKRGFSSTKITRTKKATKKKHEARSRSVPSSPASEAGSTFNLLQTLGKMAGASPDVKTMESSDNDSPVFTVMAESSLSERKWQILQNRADGKRTDGTGAGG